MFRKALRRCLEGRDTLFAEYDPLRVHPISIPPINCIPMYVSAMWLPTCLQVCDPECLLQRPETSKLLKVVRRGCIRCLGVCGPKACWTGAREGCTGAKEACTGARDSWPKSLGRPFLQLAKAPFPPSPKHFEQLVDVSDFFFSARGGGSGSPRGQDGGGRFFY